MPFVFIILSLCITLTSCNREQGLETKDTSPCYDITLSANQSLTSLDAVQEVLLVNDFDSHLDTLVFHLYANAFGDYNGTIEILSAQIDRRTVDFEVSNTILTLPCDLDIGDVATVRLTYTLTIPRCDSRLGITSQGSVNLTCFYPSLAMYENGCWRKDNYLEMGDPFYSRCSSFFVTVSIPQQYTLACSGHINLEYVNEGIRTYEIDAQNIRDFGMTVGKFKILTATANYGEVAVHYNYMDDENPQQSLTKAVSAIETFSNAFGKYPYADYTIVQSGLDAGGMEYGTFVIVSPQASQDVYLDTIIHETAHQWWYNVVGSDQLNSAWLDEGLTEFCTAYYSYLIGEREKFKSTLKSLTETYSVFSSLPPEIGFNSAMNRHLDTFVSQGEYIAVTYIKGAMLFEYLHSLVGDEKFRSTLSDYYSQNQYAIATQQSIIAAFERNGCMVRPIIEGWTNGTARI